MKEEALLGGDAGAHWYYRTKLAAVTRLCRDRPPAALLDVGAGSGFFARGLLRALPVARATCVDPNYPAEHDEAVDGKPLRFRRAVTDPDAELVLMMDVLEHVDDDAALLREYAAGARRGTRFLVTVPAFGWLWSGHDEFLGHRRRYTLAGLEAVLAAGGLRVRQGCYLFAAVLPLAAATRLGERLLPRGAPPRSQLRRHGRLANAALLAACRPELRVLGANRLGGLTALAVAEKA